MKTMLPILFVAFLLVVSGCVTDPGDVSFVDMEEELGYLGLARDREYGIVMDSEKKYKELIEEHMVQSTYPAMHSYPEIDFSRHVLLGKHASGGGCSIDYHKQVLANHKERKITYTITVESQGPCDMYSESMNWIRIDRPGSDYDYGFILGRQ
jgi:hypothetical protein